MNASLASPENKSYHRTGKIRIARFLPQLLLSAALIAVWGVPSLTDVRTGAAPAGVSLDLPLAYVMLSPVSRVLDALTILSNPQSIAIFLSIAALVIAFTVLPRRTGQNRWKRLAIALLALVVSLGVIEAAAAFLPRPMAALSASAPDVIRVDFHSHTGASHDVRKSFTAERNREWHSSGGFDAAYVSDHVKFDGAVSGSTMNPQTAGEGTSLLSAVEGRYHRIMSTVMLGLTNRDTALLNRRGNFLHGTPSSGRMPVTIIALPNRNLDSITAAIFDSLPGLAAIELVDAAPRGLGQLDREEAKIRDIASRLRLTLVAASNNHGWGRTVAAWNLMRVPGWRLLSPDSVGRLIEQPFRERRLDAVTIVKRQRPAVHGVAVAVTLPVIAYQTIGSLTPAERGVWLVWLWGISAVASRYRQRRRPS